MTGSSWKNQAGFPPADIDEAEARLEQLRPPLTRRIWPPMTYMLIPSMLGAADRLLLWLEAYEGPVPDRAEALRGELTELRQEFRRET